MTTMKDKSDNYWKQKLTAEQYRIVRQKGTEAPYTGKFVDMHEDGAYQCVACGQELFASGTKFESRSGWPSFTDPVNAENVDLTDDSTFGMHRVEVSCSNCGAHLGHVFDDGPVEQGGQRYCINSAALDFKTD